MKIHFSYGGFCASVIVRCIHSYYTGISTSSDLDILTSAFNLIGSIIRAALANPAFFQTQHISLYHWLQAAPKCSSPARLPLTAD